MNPHKFIGIAQAVAAMSKDPSTQVGSVVVNDDGVVLSLGFNGFARGVADTLARYAERDTKLKLVCHSEANAIYAAARSGHSLFGATLVVSGLFPCSNCANAIVQSGIRRVITPPINKDSKWFEENTWAQLIFREAGVAVEEYECQ